MSTSRDDFGIAIRSALLQRGARQKFSLFVLIIASILIFTLDNLELKPIKALRSVINDGVYRLSAISSSPISLASASKNFLSNHFNIYKENEELKKKIELGSDSPSYISSNCTQFPPSSLYILLSIVL